MQNKNSPDSKPPQFLMCSPDYFGVHYVINPWMEGHVNDTHNLRAMEEWRNLFSILSSCAQVSVLDGVDGVPDLVFTANAALVRNKTAVLSSFRHKERQLEEPLFCDWLSAQGYDVKVLPREVAFEGAGDALFDAEENILWFGHGVRSDISALPHLESVFETRVKPLQLLQSRFYHLDTCFCPLERGYLLYYAPAFDASSRARIESHFDPDKRISVSDEDAVTFACNAISVGGRVILNAASDALKEWLAERKFVVIETSTAEFMKAGGSTKCLSLRLT